MEPFVSPRISTIILIIKSGGILINTIKLKNDKNVINVIVNLSPNFVDRAVYKKLPQKFPI